MMDSAVFSSLLLEGPTWEAEAELRCQRQLIGAFCSFWSEEGPEDYTEPSQVLN
jgi:hypothetical protein